MPTSRQRAPTSLPSTRSRRDVMGAHYNVRVAIEEVTEAHEVPNPNVAYNRNATSTIKVERKVVNLLQLNVVASTLDEAIVKVTNHLDVHRGVDA